LHYDPVEQFSSVGFFPFLRLSETKGRWPDGQDEEFRLPRTLESCRKYQQVSEEGGQILARHLGVALPSDFFPAVMRGKRIRKVRKTKEPTRPRTPKELATALRNDRPRLRNVPEFLDMIEDRTRGTGQPVSISYEEIRRKCHKGEPVGDEAIKRTIMKSRE